MRAAPMASLLASSAAVALLGQPLSMDERNLLWAPVTARKNGALIRLIGAFSEAGMGVLSFHWRVTVFWSPVWVVMSRPEGPRRWCHKRDEVRRSLRSRPSQSLPPSRR